MQEQLPRARQERYVSNAHRALQNPRCPFRKRHFPTLEQKLEQKRFNSPAYSARGI
jgi:hypothetical protein